MNSDKILNNLKTDILHNKTISSDLESKLNLLIGKIWKDLDPTKIYSTGRGFDYYFLGSQASKIVPSKKSWLVDDSSINIYLFNNVKLGTFGISFDSEVHDVDYLILANMFKYGLLDAIRGTIIKDNESKLQDIAKHIYDNIIVDYGHLFLFDDGNFIKTYNFGLVALDVTNCDHSISYELRSRHCDFDLVKNIDNILEEVYTCVESATSKLSFENDMLDEFSLLLDVELSD